jgi:hypothetical protein
MRLHVFDVSEYVDCSHLVMTRTLWVVTQVSDEFITL